MVADQVGCPTSTAELARACWATIERRANGILHWSDAGVASWYDFAVAIGELATIRAADIGKSSRSPPTTPPCPASQLSLLDCTATRTQLDLLPGIGVMRP